MVKPSDVEFSEEELNFLEKRKYLNTFYRIFRLYSSLYSKKEKTENEEKKFKILESIVSKMIAKNKELTEKTNKDETVINDESGINGEAEAQKVPCPNTACEIKAAEEEKSKKQEPSFASNVSFEVKQFELNENTRVDQIGFSNKMIKRLAKDKVTTLRDLLSIRLITFSLEEYREVFDFFKEYIEDDIIQKIENTPYDDFSHIEGEDDYFKYFILISLKTYFKSLDGKYQKIDEEFKNLLLDFDKKFYGKLQNNGIIDGKEKRIGRYAVFSLSDFLKMEKRDIKENFEIRNKEYNDFILFLKNRKKEAIAKFKESIKMVADHKNDGMER